MIGVLCGGTSACAAASARHYLRGAEGLDFPGGKRAIMMATSSISPLKYRFPKHSGQVVRRLTADCQVTFRQHRTRFPSRAWDFPRHAVHIKLQFRAVVSGRDVVPLPEVTGALLPLACEVWVKFTMLVWPLASIGALAWC